MRGAAGLNRHGIALWMLCGLAASAWAAEDRAPVAGNAPAAAIQGEAPGFDFDIPAQSLAKALQRYAAQVDIPLVFSSDMVLGRRSAPVQGRYSADNALRLLLEGTGLAAERRDSDDGATILLKPLAAPRQEARSGLGMLLSQGDYAGRLQRRLWQALCADPLTVPSPVDDPSGAARRPSAPSNAYRLLFRFSIGENGRLYDLRLLESTGDARRDAAVLDALSRVQADPPPSAVARHTLTMSLVPDSAHPVNCDAKVDQP